MAHGAKRIAKNNPRSNSRGEGCFFYWPEPPPARSPAGPVPTLQTTKRTTNPQCKRMKGLKSSPCIEPESLVRPTHSRQRNVLAMKKMSLSTPMPLTTRGEGCLLKQPKPRRRRPLPGEQPSLQKPKAHHHASMKTQRRLGKKPMQHNGIPKCAPPTLTRAMFRQ